MYRVSRYESSGVVLLRVDFSSETRRKCIVVVWKGERGTEREGKKTTGDTELNFRLQNLLPYKEIFFFFEKALDNSHRRV